MTIDTRRNRIAVRLANHVLRLASWEYRERLAQIICAGRSAEGPRDPNVESFWNGGPGAYYAEISINPDEQRLIAHACSADRDQIVRDLRALVREAEQIATEIEATR